jgi:hypothetical protein
MVFIISTRLVCGVATICFIYGDVWVRFTNEISVCGCSIINLVSVPSNANFVFTFIYALFFVCFFVAGF